ncbi:Mut7-C RNAse domain-containing protein [Desulfogranum mediterraneum]|uniref:Mut7-C RNAse domain-containing protein n=1 Tax=Desulfogranum mediterraneum TaxID=160661 RepID=UPI00040B5BC9|nr:Mut7-C RNAse domain-containing protein [Desulfogranum mediterraneum]
MCADKKISPGQESGAIGLEFHGALRPLLQGSLRMMPRLYHSLEHRTSIKDTIESFTIPHTEIGAISVNGKSVDFSYQPCPGDQIRIYPLVPPVDPCRPSFLRPKPLPRLRFLVDVNVARLRTYLRMIGMDTLYQPQWTDHELALLAAQRGCILLSRDRGLLRRKIIEHGHLIRSEDPIQQLAEIIAYYGLSGRLNPFSRCIKCNALLQPAAKEDLLPLLEPLTRKYYDTFFRCPGCDKIYWPGSHRDAMEKMVIEALSLSRILRK